MNNNKNYCFDLMVFGPAWLTWPAAWVQNPFRDMQMNGFLDSFKITFYLLSAPAQHAIQNTVQLISQQKTNWIKSDLARSKYFALRSAQKRGTRACRTGREDAPCPIQNLVCFSVLGRTVSSPHKSLTCFPARWLHLHSSHISRRAAFLDFLPFVSCLILVLRPQRATLEPLSSGRCATVGTLKMWRTRVQECDI